MARIIPILLYSALAGACASTPEDASDRLARFRGHAGAPVGNFQYFGRLVGWTPLGQRALAVWVAPREALLLELAGSCTGLDSAPAVSISSQMGQVSARFDAVQVLGDDGGAARIPCRIREIRPLDLDALRDVAPASPERSQPDQDERKGRIPHPVLL